MTPQTLAQRLGITAPCSVLLWKLRRMRREFPVADAGDLESWLVELAHSRGFHAIQRRPEPIVIPIPLDQLTNEELAVALLHPALRDEPQLMRPAAQIISRGVVDPVKLTAVASQESASRILANLAEQALKAAPGHPVWNDIALQLGNAAPLRENVIHWTRLAEPVMKPRGPHNGEWRLVA
jgi:hypothetical protein